jgi:predicted nucleotidyltransferase
MMAHDTLIVEALEQKKQRQEWIRQQTLINIEHTLQALAEQVSFDDALIFGSVTRAYAFQADSDIDIGFQNLANDWYFFTIAFLSGQLQRDVDVLQLEQAGRLRSKILQEGISWKQLNLPS